MWRKRELNLQFSIELKNQIWSWVSCRDKWGSGKQEICVEDQEEDTQRGELSYLEVYQAMIPWRYPMSWNHLGERTLPSVFLCSVRPLPWQPGERWVWFEAWVFSPLPLITQNFPTPEAGDYGQFRYKNPKLCPCGRAVGLVLPHHWDPDE